MFVEGEMRLLWASRHLIPENLMRPVTTHKFLSFLLIAAALIVGGCMLSDPEATLLQAESDLLEGDIEHAASSCDMLSDSANTDLSPTQLCRVALLYAKISEKVEDSDYMAAAAKCFDRAIGMSNDSIESYIESLNIEDQSYVRVIREVCRTLNDPIDVSREFEDEEYGDSILHHSGDDSVTDAKHFSAKTTAAI